MIHVIYLNNIDHQFPMHFHCRNFQEYLEDYLQELLE